MQAVLIENNETGRIAYDSLVVAEPKMLHALGNKLAMKIVQELAKSPTSPIDVARRLKQHEQKIYYHINKLEKAGIIYPISSERRQGMTAKIYSVVSPVIAAKLFNRGTEVKENFTVISSDVEKIFQPFIEDGKLNAKIVVGDTYSHGKFDEASADAQYAIDFLLFLGRFCSNPVFPVYKFDTELVESDLKNNLILIGNNRTNTVINRVNEFLPIQFDESGKEKLVSKKNNSTHDDPRIGVIIKTENPFDKDKKLFIVGGIGRRGIRTCSIALTQSIERFIKGINDYDSIARIIKGFDMDGDGTIDSVKFVE